MDNKRNEDGEHVEDPEREDEDGGKQAKESLLRRTLKYLTMLDRSEEVSEENKEVVEMPEVEVPNRRREAHNEEEGGDLDLEQVRQGREEETNCMVKTLGMFELWFVRRGSVECAKAPTTKWIDRVKKNDDASTIIYHPNTHVRVVVHGDDHRMATNLRSRPRSRS